MEIFDENGVLTKMSMYFQNPKQVYEFFCQTGLDEIFTNGKITNLHDYVFGVEVGLDTNARKNRSGKDFANIISNFLKSENICFQIFFI